MSGKRGKALRLGLIAIAATGLGAVATQSAQADASGCGGNTCIHLYTPSNGQTRIDAWAYGSTYYGHIDVTRNGTVFRRSANQWIYGGGPAISFRNVTAIAGTYCAVGWTSNGGFEGRACERI